MSERTLRVAGAVLATIGAAITAYLLYARWTGGSLVCSTGGCETVQASRYSEVLGRCYAEALAHGYRWHEFGDVHLLLP